MLRSDGIGAPLILFVTNGWPGARVITLFVRTLSFALTDNRASLTFFP